MQLPICQGCCSGSQTGIAASGAVQHHRLSAAMTTRRPQSRPRLLWGLPPPTQFQPCSHSWLQRQRSSTQQRPWPLRPRLAPRRRDKIHRCSIPWQQPMPHSGHRMSNSSGTLRKQPQQSAVLSSRWQCRAQPHSSSAKQEGGGRLCPWPRHVQRWCRLFSSHSLEGRSPLNGLMPPRTPSNSQQPPPHPVLQHRCSWRA